MCHVVGAGAFPRETMDRETELRWVAGLRAGDARVFGKIFEALRPRVFAFLLRLSRRRDTADDLTQETFVRLAKASPSLDPETRLLPFLFTVARNAHRSHRRWELLDLSRIFLFGSEHDEVARAHDEQAHASRELRDVELAVGALSVTHREVLLLVAVEGMAHEEAAQVLAIAPEALRQRLSRARKALAEELSRRARRATLKAPEGGVP